MRRRWVLFFAGAAVFLATSAAQAGTLTAASWLQVIQGFPMTRTFSRGLGQLPFTISGSAWAGVDNVSVHLTYPAVVEKFFVPKTANGVLDLAISITQGGSQTIVATPGGGVANQGVVGSVVVRVATHNQAGVNQSMYLTGMTTLVKVPLNVGVDGQATNSFKVSGIAHFVTVDFFAWTPGSFVFTGLTSRGQALPSATAAGSWALNAGPFGGATGTVTLVSPTKISIDCVLAQRKTASFTSLKLYFVPEPSTLMLLGASAAALVLSRRGSR